MFTKIYATDHTCVTDQVGTTAPVARRSIRNRSLCEDTGKCTTNILQRRKERIKLIRKRETRNPDIIIQTILAELQTLRQNQIFKFGKYIPIGHKH